MSYTLDEKYKLIKEKLLEIKSNSPLYIARLIMNNDFVNMHGPEHHFIDGASLLAAMHNSGLDFDLEKALDLFAERSIKMPGAMCGYWGVCGSVTSVSAVFSILEGTGPLSNDENYSNHMSFTSSIISRMSKIGGPRCCKRNAYISIGEGIKYANEKYNLKMPVDNVECDYSDKNLQCIKTRCPFHK